jgi:hypothetical protein
MGFAEPARATTRCTAAQAEADLVGHPDHVVTSAEHRDRGIEKVVDDRGAVVARRLPQRVLVDDGGQPRAQAVDDHPARRREHGSEVVGRPRPPVGWSTSVVSVDPCGPVGVVGRGAGST